MKIPHPGQKFKFKNRERMYVIIKLDEDSNYLFYIPTKCFDDSVFKCKIPNFVAEQERGNIEYYLGD